MSNKSDIKCEVIRDLLPLYVDEVVSDESRALIEEHLKKCSGCKEYCTQLQEGIPEESDMDFTDETASLRKIKRKINLNKILIIMVTLGFAIIAGLFLSSQHLTDYEGSLEENLSYELPAGYTEYDSQEADADYKTYVRESSDKREVIDLRYEGLDTQIWSGDEKVIQIDGETKVILSYFDWDHSYDNSLACEIQHGSEKYLLDYQCQETDRDKYYSSCSEAQEAEIIDFIRTFDYHRPDNASAGNIFVRLYRNYGVGGCIVLALTLLFFIGIPVAIGISGLMASGDKKDDADAIISSKDLHESMNRERKARGETSIPSINNVQGASSSNLARRDHSWSSVPDFFIKLFRRK